MEVHAHTHNVPDPDSHRGLRKKWTHYFWEFFMLFLAVFCGFLAEYQLEHIIEHQREKQYIRSLVEDLTADQQILSQHVRQLKNGVSEMDSVINILNSPAQLATNTGALYYLARLAPRLSPLTTNTRTYEQLKNSGNFRLIRNLESSNKIMSYYEKFPLIRLLESVNETEFSDYKILVSKIFNSSVFMRMEGENGIISRSPENPPLRSNDNELLQELSVFAVYMRGTKNGILAADKELQTAGMQLLDYLQREYHLK